MTTAVTKESLAARIAELESGPRSLKEDYTLAAYKMLLATMEAEPVAYVPESQLNLLERAVVVEADLSKGQRFDEIPLYRHARPASEYPETLPCPVLLEPGLRFGKGIKTSTMLAALARRAVHESDMAALSPEEKAKFQARIEDFKAFIAQPAPVVPGLDEREAFEAFVEGRFGDTVDRRRAKNGDQGYMAWDMAMAWVVWEARANKQK